jgi:hypothetical protein
MNSNLDDFLEDMIIIKMRRRSFNKYVLRCRLSYEIMEIYKEEKKCIVYFTNRNDLNEFCLFLREKRSYYEIGNFWHNGDRSVSEVFGLSSKDIVPMLTIEFK